MAQCSTSSALGTVSYLARLTDSSSSSTSSSSTYSASCRWQLGRSRRLAKGSLGHGFYGGSLERCCRSKPWGSRIQGGTQTSGVPVSLIRETEKSLKTGASGYFPLQDVLEAQQFDRELLNSIFKVAREMEDVERNSAGSELLKGFLMATLFYEPSTRTRLSFESAMKRLGGEVLTTENAREFSSASKGETLEDTIRTVEGYSDIIVLRHFESGAAKKAAEVANIPIINAGDGPGQHPTQALLDMYTIQREIGHLHDIKVGLVGDLANGRTVRSLAYLLAKYDGVEIYFVAPDVVKMKDDIKDYLTSQGVHWEESADLMEVASKCDVVYQTRIQRERFGDQIDLYNEARGKFIVDNKVMSVLPEHAVILHPLPRLDEITLEVDSDPRAAYFRQAKNGLYIRMALLKLLLLGY